MGGLNFENESSPINKRINEKSNGSSIPMREKLAKSETPADQASSPTMERYLLSQPVNSLGRQEKQESRKSDVKNTNQITKKQQSCGIPRQTREDIMTKSTSELGKNKTSSIDQPIRLQPDELQNQLEKERGEMDDTRLRTAVQLAISIGYHLRTEAFDFLKQMAATKDPAKLIEEAISHLENLEEKPFFIERSYLEQIYFERH